MSDRDPGVIRAITAAGNTAKLAALLGITSQAVSQWDKVPTDRLLDVEKATGVSRTELRPDLFRGLPSRRAKRSEGQAA